MKNIVSLVKEASHSLKVEDAFSQSLPKMTAMVEIFFLVTPNGHKHPVSTPYQVIRKLCLNKIYRIKKIFSTFTKIQNFPILNSLFVITSFEQGDYTSLFGLTLNTLIQIWD